MPNNIPLPGLPPRLSDPDLDEPVLPTFSYGTTFLNMLQDGFNNGSSEQIHYLGQEMADKVDGDDIPLNDDQRKNFETKWGVKLPLYADPEESRIIVGNQQMKLNSQLMLASADSYGKHVVAQAGYLTGQLAQVPAIIGGVAAAAALSPEEGIVAGGGALIDAGLNLARATAQSFNIGFGAQLGNELVNTEYDYATGKNYSYKAGALRLLESGSMTAGIGIAGHVIGEVGKKLGEKFEKARVNRVISQMGLDAQNSEEVRQATAPETLRPVISAQRDSMISANKALVKSLSDAELPKVDELEPHIQTEKVNGKVVSVPTNIRNVGKKIKFWLANFDNKSDVLPNVLASLHETIENHIKLLSPEVQKVFNTASNATTDTLDGIDSQVEWDLNSNSPGHNIGGLFKTFSPLRPDDEDKLNKIANAQFELGRIFEMDGPIKDSLNKNAQQLLAQVKAMNIDPDEVAEILDSAFDKDKKALDKNFTKIKEIDKKVKANPKSISLKLKQSNLYDLQTTHVNSAMTHDYLRKIMRDGLPKPTKQDFIDGVENYTNQAKSVGAQDAQSVPVGEKERPLESMRDDELQELKDSNKSTRTSLEQKEVSKEVLDQVKKNDLMRSKLKELVESAYTCLQENE